MKASAIILLGFFVLSSCLEPSLNVDEDTIFNAVVGLFKGMAKTEEARCSASITNGKTQILEIVHSCIEEIKAGTDIIKAIGSAGMKIMGVSGVMSDCNVLQMTSLIPKFTTKDGFLDVLNTMVSNIDTIWSYGEKIPTAITDKKYDEAAEAFGHIAAIALKFNVN